MKNKTAMFALLIMTATIISRVVGFFREITIGSVLGTSNVADAYLVSLSLPSIVFTNVMGAVATTFMPLYVKKRELDGQKESLRFTNNLMNVVFLISIFLCVVAIIFARQLTAFLALGFDEETLELSTKISRIILTSIIFMGTNAILTNYLRANNRFLLGCLTGIPMSIIVIVSLLLYDKFGIMGVAYANLIGMLIQTILLCTQSIFTGFRFDAGIDLKDSAMREILILAMPVFIGTSVGQINALVDRMMASGLPHGSISALNFANKLNNFIFAIMAASISMAIYPLLSKLSVNKDKGAYKDVISKSFSAITVLMLPVAVAACILNEFTVRLLFERGAFDGRSTILTASALFYYSFGTLFMGYNTILDSAFYSMQDTKTPLKNGMVCISLNICLILILVPHMAHNGIALATSISTIVANLLLTWLLRKKIGAIGGRKILITVMKAGIACAFMGIVIKVLQMHFEAYFNTGTLLSRSFIFCGISLVGLIVYGALLCILKTEELKWFIGLVTLRKR